MENVKNVMVGEIREDSPKGGFSRTVAKIESDDLYKIQEWLCYKNDDFLFKITQDENVNKLLQKILDDTDTAMLDNDLCDLALYNVGFNYYKKD